MLILKRDLKEAAAIERRRRLEEERKARIFNPRCRMIGVDKDTLDRQVQERRAKQDEERQLNETFDRQRIQDAELSLLIEKNIEEERRKINKEINEFRAVHQAPQTRREFDLYDPDALKKSLPARVQDDDPRCSVSSAQKFLGEDLCSKERQLLQRTQTKSWLEQQITERRREEWERRCADKAYEDAMIVLDKRACDLDKLEQECRRRLSETTLRYNKTLASEQNMLRCSGKQKEQEDNEAEIFNTLTGDLLCENRDVHTSNLGPHRVQGCMYKGMSDDERVSVRREQLRQIQERAKQRQVEAHNEAQWNQLTSSIARHVFLKDRELLRKQRELRKDVLEHNKRLSEEQKARQCFLDKQVYTDCPTDAYYAQFNTSTR